MKTTSTTTSSRSEPPGSRPPPRAARRALLFGGSSGAAAVALGAFGAHALESRVPYDRLETWNTAVLYHLFHTVGLLVVGLMAARRTSSRRLDWAARLMVAGILLFSGSLYALALTGLDWLGAITPLGGVAFVVAWLLVALAGLE